MSSVGEIKVTLPFPRVIVLDPLPVAPYPITVSLLASTAEGTVSAPMNVLLFPLTREVPPTLPPTICIPACLPIPTFLLPVVILLNTCRPIATLPVPVV